MFPVSHIQGGYWEWWLRSGRAMYGIGALSELRKDTIGFIMSVCPPARMEQIVFHRTHFLEM